MPASASMDKTETLAWLRRISGDLATATIKRLEDTLPWYADMPPARRSAVGLVAQAGITSFISWYEDPTSTPWIAADITTTTNTPMAIPRIVSAARTLFARRASSAMTTPSASASIRSRNRMPYSWRSAAIGSSRAARLAG